MILVNNPGSWSAVYAPLQHASWHGLTPTDLVFPFFLFIMGISTYLSLSKFEFKLCPTLFIKVLKRSILIFAIGFVLNLIGIIPTSINYEGSMMIYLIEHIRILGVLQRLALCYFFGTIFLSFIPIRWLLDSAMLILFIYALLLGIGNGYEFSENNIIAIVDNALFGSLHLYHDILPSGAIIAFDPEGLLSTLPSIAQLLLGVYCGYIFSQYKKVELIIPRIAVIGTMLLFAGLLLSYGVPLNKKIWSSSFALCSSGFAMLLLTVLVWIVDYQKHKKWAKAFVEFGTNPLFIYVFSGLLAQFVANIKVDNISVQAYLYSLLTTICRCSYAASLLYAIIFVTICWGICKWLYNRGIVIKL
ncbi:MAG: acyltransferase family protein [Bacteroidales bacterium]